MPSLMPVPQLTSAPNPYASPQGTYQSYGPPSSGRINPQIVEVSPIVNHALKIWQDNLGLLIGMTLLPIVIMVPAQVFGFIVVVMTAPMREPIITFLVMIMAYAATVSLQVFLGIGQTRICNKLARGQQATIGEMFAGTDCFFPVLGWSLLVAFILPFAFLAFVVPGVMLLLMFWPSYHLLVDGKCGVMESFSIANRITEGNKMTTFVVLLVMYGFAALGSMACLVGTIFVVPLISLLWSSAYLMMSGQIPVPPPQRPYYPPEPAYQR